MMFRYWMGDRKKNVIRNVDRVVFEGPDRVRVLVDILGKMEWYRFVFEKDFVEFSVTSE